MEGFSPAFLQIDGAFTAPHEGGKTRNDGTGHTAAFGIDQNAHPGINVLALTPQQAAKIRHDEYWKPLNLDMLVKINPKLAMVAYDTAIMSGPGTAKQMLRQSGGDEGKMLQLRVDFQNRLQRENPAKYGGAKHAWETRNADLAKALGQPFPVAPAGSAQVATAAPVTPGAPQPGMLAAPESPSPEPPKPEEPSPVSVAPPVQAHAQQPQLLNSQGAQPLLASTGDRYKELLESTSAGRET